MPDNPKARENQPPTKITSRTYTFPENLSDANEDGYVDEGDFIRSFANLVNICF